MRTPFLLLLVWVGIFALLGCEDEPELSAPTTFGIWNLTQDDIYVAWNADPGTQIRLEPEFFTTVKAVRSQNGTQPGVDATPIWCVRVRRNPGGNTVFHHGEIPLTSYVKRDQGRGGPFYLLAVDDAFLDLFEESDGCMMAKQNEAPSEPAAPARWRR